MAPETQSEVIALQIGALDVGVVSAIIGFSAKAFYRLNPKINWLDNIFLQLQVRGELTDRKAIRELLYFTRSGIAKWDELREMQNAASDLWFNKILDDNSRFATASQVFKDGTAENIDCNASRRCVQSLKDD